MTVAELIEKLKGLPQDLPVVAFLPDETYCFADTVKIDEFDVEGFKGEQWDDVRAVLIT